MAGALTISTLNDSSGVLATQNGMKGVLKAWVNFNGSTGTINNSFNISSLTRTATGLYTIVFTTAMPNATYGVICTAGQGGRYLLKGVVGSTTTTTYIECEQSSTGAYLDSDPSYVAIFSS